MENKVFNPEAYRINIYNQWQKLVEAGISVQQIVDYLGRPDLKLVHTFPKTGTLIERFDIQRFIRENENALNPIFLPDLSFPLPSAEALLPEVTEDSESGDILEGKYTITLKSLSIVTEKSEKFLMEVIHRMNIILKKVISNEEEKLCMTSEDAQQIMKDLDSKLIDDDWIFWENYPPEVAQAMRGYIKKTNIK